MPWRQGDLSQRGHAIECRIYAEDPAQGFLPQAGTLIRFRQPHGPGVRVDSGYVEGNEVSVYYDPLTAKLIVHAETRAAAIARVNTALAEFDIAGIQTNIPFLQQIVRHPRFIAADLDTHFLDTELESLLSATGTTTPSPQGPPGPPGPLGPLVTSGFLDPFIALGPWRIGSDRPAATSRDVRTATKRRRGTAATDMSAPMPATVVKVLVQPGARVGKGDTLIMLEAMKMELPIKAPRDGVVRAVNCQPGELVQPGVNLVELEA